MDARVLKTNDFWIEEDFRGSESLGTNLKTSVSTKVMIYMPQKFTNLEFLSIR
jgi:hypothetical protein